MDEKRAISIVEVGGIKIELTEEGYLNDESQWNEKVAEFLAQRDGLTLGEKHWQLIYIIRRYYDKFLLPPVVRVFYKMVYSELGYIKNANDVYRLFPKGYNSILLIAGCKKFGHSICGI